MHRVFTDEDLRHRLIQAGRERCRYFSWERTARETLKVLEKAAAGTHNYLAARKGAAELGRLRRLHCHPSRDGRPR